METSDHTTVTRKTWFVPVIPIVIKNTEKQGVQVKMMAADQSQQA